MQYLRQNVHDHPTPLLVPMVSKMQKNCAWAEMYQNDGLPWIYPVRDMEGGSRRPPVGVQLHQEKTAEIFIPKKV
jgi:hypothetical protein